MSGVYFISDAHLGIESVKKEEFKKRALLSFLDEVKADGTALYILGDLYDFWFEYRRGVSFPDSAIADRLGALVSHGMSVTYVAGNHDYWLGRFWAERGIRTSKEPVTTEIQGKRIFMAHGDGLGASEPGYLLTKWLLRNRVSIALYSRLGRSIGNGLSVVVSRLSRAKSNKAVPKMTEGLLRYAMTKFNDGVDVVICGHIHSPTLVTVGDRIFCLLGDWMEHFTYAKMKGGQLELLSWRAG